MFIANLFLQEKSQRKDIFRNNELGTAQVVAYIKLRKRLVSNMHTQGLLFRNIPLTSLRKTRILVFFCGFDYIQF